MNQGFDVAKFVGAASAPVALIIATSIFLSNLTARYSGMFTAARQLAEEYRKSEDRKSERHNDRTESLRLQLGLYHYRLDLIMRATFWLTLTIWLFIGTVFFTSVAIALPDNKIWAGITAVTMFAGLITLAGSVGIEAWENHLARKALNTEMSEFPEVDSRQESVSAQPVPSHG